ncbi:hypothetical protein [Streptomyces sp. NPDC021356]|uniref:hypothetical protein n=1 Tax=Streptomyces sp. NPDC021356 TaxID=3154900 RepID=UPI0033DE38E0
MYVSRLFRAMRAAMFGAVCVVLAAVGHVWMSGMSLPWPVLALAAVATALTGWLFAAEERRRRTVVLLTLAMQACLHVAFTLSQSLAHATTPTGPSSAATPEQWARLLLCGDATPEAAARAYDLAVQTGLTPQMHMPAAGRGGGAMAHDMAGMASTAGMHPMDTMSGTASWGMLAAHVAAALMCGIWLALGERAAFCVLRAVADRAFVPLRLVLALCPVAEAPVPARRTGATVAPLRSRLLVHTLTTRGPPGAPAVA